MDLDAGRTNVDIDHLFKNNKTAEWNHGTGEIVQAAMDAGMVITGVIEYKGVPYGALLEQMAQTGPFGDWELKEGKDKMRLSYTLQALKLK